MKDVDWPFWNRSVRLFDNSAKDDPPILAYDSNLDPEWQAGQKIDVVSYVEGRSGPQIPTSPTSTESIPDDNISKTDNVPLTKIISGGKLWAVDEMAYN